MISTEKLKSEIDHIPTVYYKGLFNLLKSLEGVKKIQKIASNKKPTISQVNTNWEMFIQRTYGSLSNDPIIRVDQGTIDPRSKLL